MRYFLLSVMLHLSLAANAQRPPAMPWDTTTAGGISWTTAHHDSLFLSTNGGSSWHFEHLLAVDPVSMVAHADSTVTIMDINNDSYLYSLPAHRLTAYVPNKPLAEFLTAPVISISISNMNGGCFSFSSSSIVYSKTGSPSVLHAKSYGEEGTYNVEKPGNYKKTKAWSHNMSLPGLQAILQAINDDPVSMPAIKDFKISNADKQRHPAIANKLDTLGVAALKQTLAITEGGGRNHKWFSIDMVNSKNDTIIFYTLYTGSGHAWHLPWMVSYRGLGFKCYSLAFSKFLSGCLPKDFAGFDMFSNEELLKVIEAYLKQQDSTAR